MASLIVIKWGGVEITSLGNIFGLGEIPLGSFSEIFTVIPFIQTRSKFDIVYN